MPEVIFTGPAGRLEGRYHPAKQKNAPIAIMLHPHPQFGGTMNNPIVYHLYYAFAHRGFSVLRFNFRGVGRSQGSFDHGRASCRTPPPRSTGCRRINPEARACWIAGFSFGAWIGMQLADAPPGSRRLHLDRAAREPLRLLVPRALPVVRPDRPWRQGCVVPAKDVGTLVEKLKTQKGIVIEQHIMKGANHFFDGKVDTLMETVNEYLDRPFEVRAVERLRRIEREEFMRKCRRDQRGVRYAGSGDRAPFIHRLAAAREHQLVHRRIAGAGIESNRLRVAVDVGNIRNAADVHDDNRSIPSKARSSAR
jgi:alpha/beta superfamily hydrolase